MRGRFWCVPLLVALALVLPEHADAGACAGPMANLVLLTPRATRVPVGMGLLLGAQMPGQALGQEQPAFLGPVPALQATLERAGVSIALSREEIAPGLTRLVPASRPTPGRWQLRRAEASVQVTFTERAPRPVLAAPSLGSVWVAEPSYADIRGGGIGPRGRAPAPLARLLAQLSSDRPAGAVALILHAVHGETHTAFVATATPTTTRSLTLHAPSGGRCAPLVYGSSVPAGSVVVATFVDAFGRQSAPSAPVTVTSR